MSERVYVCVCVLEIPVVQTVETAAWLDVEHDVHRKDKSIPLLWNFFTFCVYPCVGMVTTLFKAQVKKEPLWL